MIEYLKSVIGQQLAAQNPVTNEEESEIDNSTILEYASMFQELDDLSEKGTAIETAVRTPISIPLDDDIELDSIEINLTDGRVTDIPADATVQEAELTEEEATIKEEAEAEPEIIQIEQQYAGMKTYEQFYAEAASTVVRLPRESDERYARRVHDTIGDVWKKYNEYLYQESAFGHGKSPIGDKSVPDKISLNFGKKGNRDYHTTLPLKWETDKDGRVTKKQLDSVAIWSKVGRIALERFTDEVLAKVGGDGDKWDVLTPVIVGVPVEPTDQYCIIVGFETDSSRDIVYYSACIPVKSIKVIDNKSVENISAKCSHVSDIDSMTRKRDFKLEHAVDVESPRIRPRFSRFWQEAIDLGSAPAADPNAQAGGNVTPPPAPDATNTDPTANAMDPNMAASNAGAIDANADPNAQGADIQPAPDAEPANVNDVSDQIADKVSQSTEDQTMDSGESAAAEAEDAPDMDLDAVDNSTNPEDIKDVDSEIDSLDDAGNAEADKADDSGLGDIDTSDLDNLTIDQLIAQGSEKLKGMTINQLKSFINSPDGTTPEEVTEAFVQNQNATTPPKEIGPTTNTKTKLNIPKEIGNTPKDSSKNNGANPPIPKEIGEETIKEYDEDDIHIIDDDEVMMENFFTDASNIRERIKVAIDDVIPGLNKIKEGCSGDWDRYDLKKFWYGVAIKDNIDLQNTYKIEGDRFCSYITDLRHFLKVAKKKRAKDAFSEEELAQLDACNDRLVTLGKMINKATSKLYVKNDISLKNISEQIDDTMKLIEDIQKIIGSEKFTEFYIQEGFFITKKNVNNKLEAHIKASLAILNSTKESYSKLVELFKKESKRMNKVLTKAIKMKIYTEDEKAELVTLNKRLLDLCSYLRMNNLNDTYTNRVKMAITEYSKQCKVVSKIISKYTGSSTPKQEAFITTYFGDEEFVKEMECCANKEPEAVNENDTDISDTASGTPDSMPTTTANTTIGTDSVNDIGSVPSGTPDDTNSVDSVTENDEGVTTPDSPEETTTTDQGVPSGTPDMSDADSVTESESVDVDKEFEEFMKMY